MKIIVEDARLVIKREVKAVKGWMGAAKKFGKDWKNSGKKFGQDWGKTGKKLYREGLPKL